LTIYSSITDAAQALLVESAQIANESNLEYAVIGGWSPFLRNQGEIRHPGTKDVDLLFREGETEQTLREVVRQFLKGDFIPSAKHEFQLLRILEVQGQELVFNVDLLHASEKRQDPDLFCDHLQLPIFAADGSRILVKSISGGVSKFVFDGYVENEVVADPLEATNLVDVPVINETASLVLKSRSMGNVKRPRDSFDALLALRQPRNEKALLRSLETLRIRHEDQFEELSGLLELTKDKARQNITKYWPPAADPATWDSVQQNIKGILSTAGIGDP
jgi:hypothetical protein